MKLGREHHRTQMLAVSNSGMASNTKLVNLFDQITLMGCAMRIMARHATIGGKGFVNQLALINRGMAAVANLFTLGLEALGIITPMPLMTLETVRQRWHMSKRSARNVVGMADKTRVVGLVGAR